MYYIDCLSDRAKEVWNLFGARDKVSYISVHSLVQNPGKSRASSLLAVHILPACNVTSKVGTKAAAIRKWVRRCHHLFSLNKPNLTSCRELNSFLSNYWTLQGNAIPLMIYSIICAWIREKFNNNFKTTTNLC